MEGEVEGTAGVCVEQRDSRPPMVAVFASCGEVVQRRKGGKVSHARQGFHLPGTPTSAFQKILPEACDEQFGGVVIAPSFHIAMMEFFEILSYYL